VTRRSVRFTTSSGSIQTRLTLWRRKQLRGAGITHMGAEPGRKFHLILADSISLTLRLDTQERAVARRRVDGAVFVTSFPAFSTGKSVNVDQSRGQTLNIR